MKVITTKFRSKFQDLIFLELILTELYFFYNQPGRPALTIPQVEKAESVLFQKSIEHEVIIY